MSVIWHIVGAGAIGSLFACKLHRAGIPVQRVFRNASRLQEQKPVLQLIEPGGASDHCITSGCMSDSSAVHAAIICTKASEAAAAFEQLRPRLAPDAPVILLHNGMGVVEEIQSRQAYANLVCATTTEGAYWDGHTLVHAGHGPTVIGQQGIDAPQWLGELSQADPGIHWDRDIEQSLWRKLMVNCAINPLTAVLSCRNGELMQTQHATRVANLVTELQTISQALGYPEIAADLQSNVETVIRNTAENLSSMAADVGRGRRTEIEYITGYLCRAAYSTDTPCPLNQALLEQVRALDSKVPQD